MLGSIKLLTVLIASVASVHARSRVDGSLSLGPSGQGSCTVSATRPDQFACANGATCRWQADDLGFSCSFGTGADGSTVAGADASSGPPGRQCVAHVGHWDCDDGSLCEIQDGVWLCESFSSSEHADGESGACVVHGGHTHGDW